MPRKRSCLALDASALADGLLTPARTDERLQRIDYLIGAGLCYASRLRSERMRYVTEVECSRVGKKALLMWTATESLLDAEKLVRVNGSEHCSCVGMGGCPVKGFPQARDYSQCPHLPQCAPQSPHVDP
jgi:hypothetical protein